MSSRARTLVLLAVFGAGCSKKRAPPTPTVAASASPAASTLPSAESPPAVLAGPSASDAALDTAPPDDAIEAELVLLDDLDLGEGKPLPAPKFTPADKRALEAHAAAIQAAFDAQQKDLCRETVRFNASFVPATYLFCTIAGREGPRLTDSTPTITRMISIEGTATQAIDLAESGPSRNHGDATPYALWNTPRGYFLDLGDGQPTYILRRTRVHLGEADPIASHIECRGKRWSQADGAVTDVAVPTFPTRGRDLHDDGTPEFPAPIFTFAFDGWKLATPPPLETACDVPDDGGLRLDVGGIEGGDRPVAFHERKLAAARARANRQRVALGLPKLVFPVDGSAAPDAAPPTPKEQVRKKGTLRMSNACALDVAQAAAEVYVHGVLSGFGRDVILEDVDAMMRGFTLKLGECGGLLSDGKVARDVDHWPEVRAALVAYDPKG